MKKDKQKTHREVISFYLKDMEFMTGLKQVRDMGEGDIKKLVDYLENVVFRYRSWLNVKRLEIIFDNGFLGKYGDFYGMNAKTLDKWINFYHSQNVNQITSELQNKETDKRISEAEIAKWRNLARENFLKQWNYSVQNKKVRDLIEWNPWFFNHFQDKGILKPEKYPIADFEKEAKTLNRLSGRGAAASLVPQVNNMIWKSFILECVENGPDLGSLIKNQ